MSKPGLSLVKAISLDKGAGHISLDLGATLFFPDELSLTADDGNGHGTDMERTWNGHGTVVWNGRVTLV